ncbi:hypothetical protein [Geodermatophilus sp. URMC 63]
MDVQLVALALLAAGLLAVGTPTAVGRTLLAAAAGLATALVTGLGSSWLYGSTVPSAPRGVAVRVLALVVVGGLAATPVRYRLRQWLVGVVRRRPRPT